MTVPSNDEVSAVTPVEEEPELASLFNARSLPTVVMIRKNGSKGAGTSFRPSPLTYRYFFI